MKTLRQKTEAVLAVVFRGLHNAPKIQSTTPGRIDRLHVVTHAASMATFDFDSLTRLVFAAHDECVRVHLAQGGPGTVKICFTDRKTREGDSTDRRPTIETALAQYRLTHESI